MWGAETKQGHRAPCARGLYTRMTQVTIMESRQATHHIYSLEVCLLAVLILLKIKSGHARISVSKIVIPKAVRINPCIYVIFYSIYNKIFLKAIK